jgi:hypothetical protein
MQNRWPYERIGTSNGLPLTGLIKHYLDQSTLENIIMDRVRGRPLIYGTHYCWLMTSTTLQKAQLLICLQAWTWRFWILHVVYLISAVVDTCGQSIGTQCRRAKQTGTYNSSYFLNVDLIIQLTIRTCLMFLSSGCASILLSAATF